MLINASSRQKYIFIANTKTASTSIENILINYSSISIKSPPALKHMGYKNISSNFNFLFSRPNMSIDSFYKFGVIREPVDWLVSWFNYRSREQLADPQHRNHKNYTGNLDFDGFIEMITRENRIKPQSNLFLDHKGNNAMDFIIKYENLHDDFNFVSKKLGLDLELPHKNRSTEKRMNSEKVLSSTMDKIRKFYAIDYELIESISKKNELVMN